ncbi:MAG TPA: type II CAAX endopeptidase family protein [Planctomycetota bacterium]|nr:type II CAAX endopeptidase family protein [Planctomycetota bacterium]
MPAPPDPRTLAVLFALAFVATDWALLFAPVGYVWHAGAVAALLLVERRVRVTAPSPFGWGAWRASLRHFARVAAVCAAVVVVVLVLAVAVIRIGGFRFELQPRNVHDVADFGDWFWLAVVWAPLAEEWIYRGVVQPRLREAFGARAAIVLSGVLFWLYHWIAHGGVTAPNHLLAGWLFAWSWQRTGSLVAPTLLHAAGNLSLGLADALWLTRPELVRGLLGW